MCAAAWDGITRNLAQKIAGKNRGEHLKRRHWLAFALECGLNAAAPRQAGRRTLRAACCARSRAAAAEVDAMPAGTHMLMPKFVEAIEARARAILAGAASTRRRERSVEPACSPAKAGVEATQQERQSGSPVMGRRLATVT